MAVVVLLLVWLACGFYAGTTASDKGHPGGAWFVGGLLFGPIALIAGCGSGPVQAWTIDAVSGQKTSLGQGEHTACGNKDGSFEAVALPGLRFGWANCISNCVEGATPNQTTVQLNGNHKPGNVAKFSGFMVCVSQAEKPLLYCWK